MGLRRPPGSDGKASCMSLDIFRTHSAHGRDFGGGHGKFASCKAHFISQVENISEIYFALDTS